MDNMTSKWAQLETIELGGQLITTASCQELTEAMIHDCTVSRERGGVSRPRLVFDANGQGVSMYETNVTYKDAVDKADIIHADGAFLVLFSKILKRKRISERSATTDLIHDMAKGAEDNDLSFYLLGGTEEVNSECAAELARRYPKLRVVGRRNGYFTPDQAAGVIEDINATAPDILWVGLGKPKEQTFAVQWRDSLRCGWLVTCGGCFNFVVGKYTRAPQWMQQAGLEWVYRLYKNPRQLFLRYLLTSPHAIWIVFRCHLRTVISR